MATIEAGEFERSLKRLEEIVGQLEKQDVTLDESVKLFEEGKLLAARCETLLAQAQAKIAAAGAAPANAPNGAGEAVSQPEIPF